MDNWKTGIDLLHNSGSFWSGTASYFEGTIYTGMALCQGASDFISDPFGTIGDGISSFTENPLKNNPIYGFYAGLATASYNHDWNGVAYCMGGGITNAGFVLGSAITSAHIASTIAPNCLFRKSFY